ncbi:MAG TPA: hypothetical protein VFQ99_03460 [Gallionella sp.]|nr:hypothetical protein [Gallionella sp.]
MEKIARCSVFEFGVGKFSGSAYMPHVAADSVSAPSGLVSGISSFVLSFSNSFDQCKVFAAVVMRVNVVGRGMWGRGINRL